MLGLYWERSTTQGAVWSIVLGMTTWALLSLTPLGEVIPSVLAGLVMAGIGMVVGSLLPTAGNRAHREDRARYPHGHHAGARPHG